MRQRTAATLLEGLLRAGCRVRLDGGEIEIAAPRGVLTPALREQLLERKPELVALLQAAPDHPRRAGLMDRRNPPRPCRVCSSRRFWRSIHGAIVCGSCHPPAADTLVAEWIDEPGDVEDASDG